MKITNANLIRVAGLCAVIGRMCYVFVGVFHILGGLLLGIATFRARILPCGAAVLLALGALSAPVGALLSLSAQPKIAIPTGLALAWLGYALMTERQAPDTKVGNQSVKAAA